VALYGNRYDLALMLSVISPFPTIPFLRILSVLSFIELYVACKVDTKEDRRLCVLSYQSHTSFKNSMRIISGFHTIDVVGRDSAVVKTTHYGLDGPGIESWWGQDFLDPSRPALGPTWPPIQWVPGLSQG